MTTNSPMKKLGSFSTLVNRVRARSTRYLDNVSGVIYEQVIKGETEQWFHQQGVSWVACPRPSHVPAE